MGRSRNAWCTRSADPRRAAHPLDACLIFPEQRKQSMCGLDRTFGGLRHPAKEKCQPRFPVAPVSHFVEKRVVVVPMLLEKEAQIEKRLTQRAAVMQHEGDQKAPHPSVAVEEGMDGLELDMSEAGPQEQGQPVVVRVQKAFQIEHAIGDRGNRRRDETRHTRSQSADPVLRTAKLPGRLVAATAPAEQYLVNFADEPVAERKILAQPTQPVFQGRHVVRDLHDIVERDAGRLVQFEQQEVGQRGLRALDLRGKDSLLADIGVEEEADVGQQRGKAVQASESEQGSLQTRLQNRQVQGGRRRQRRRNEGLHRLATHDDRFVSASLTPIHAERSLVKQTLIRCSTI